MKDIGAARRAALSRGFDALDALNAAVAALDRGDDLRACLAAIRDDLAAELEQRWSGRSPSATAEQHQPTKEPTSAERLLERLWAPAGAIPR